ncbi:MAG: glycine--tRNA ligase subunit beta [Coriobacteriia bacterium]|nr:glycine--tRNA ligase subunit beta [Coriobacteriia bacterium]
MLKTITFEIGLEELPAHEVHNAVVQVKKIVCNQPGKIFDYEDIKIYATPRRIILNITGVPESIPAKTEEFKGPKAEIAFSDGKPTKAAIGFARGKGLEVDDLTERDGYVYAVKSQPEQKIIDILPELLTSLIDGLNWKKVMRWGDRPEEFARPVRWLLAMFGSDVIDLEYAGVKSSNYTYAHRFLSPGKHEVKDADNLIPLLDKNKVVVDEESRKKIILDQIKDIEKKSGLKADTPQSILSEVTNLCEYPTCMVGEFDKLFLSVPKEIIVDAMLVHQRYFPLFTKNGKLTNKFIVVSNGDAKFEEQIIDGNQRVVAARLYDAKFFYDEDLKHPFEYYVDKLDSVVFQEQLGTMKDKAERIQKIAKFMCDTKDVARASLLCKADLVTSAVVEFTSVQGIMGGYYAKASGENDEVSAAIAEHYMPRFAGDDLPSNDTGKCVAIADKIDTLCGMFAIDMLPTGSSDPFALRRGTIGILNIIRSGFPVSLTEVVKFALSLFDKLEAYDDVMEFILTRTRVMLKDEGLAHESIEAIAVDEPLEFINRAKALDEARKTDAFEDLETAFARANNLRDAKLGTDFDSSIFGPEEKALSSAIDIANKNISKYLKDKDYDSALKELAKLRGPIDDFFEGVMVMDKDETVKNNRLKLLNAFVAVFGGYYGC